jgi:ketosteroid isomerase-like protein
MYSAIFPKRSLAYQLIFFILLFCLSGSSARAQKTLPTKTLYTEIAKMDSLLFDAFNSRNIEKLKIFFSTDLEVYQDNTGLRNYSQTVTSFTELFKKEYVLKRKLVAQSMEVYPVKDFGAIQTGRHTFCHTENGKLECATFRFMHVWEKTADGWKIKRLITYDH